MSELNPDNFWLSYANSGASASNVNFTTDGGTTWSSNMLQVGQSGSVDYHLSLFGKSGELYFTWPGNGIQFRKFNAPAHDNNDRGPLVSFAGTTSSYRSNVMVQDNGRIWVFTRLTGDPNQNVRYQYSDDNGANWTAGQAYATGAIEVRFGSMPYINGNPALIVLHLGDNRGYEYYLWNGSAFEALNDHSIFPVNVGQARAFTHNVINDTTMHLIFGYGNNLYHLWKNFNNGNGAWNQTIIDNSSSTIDNDWYPTSTVQGNDLYVFYCKKSDFNFSSSRVYYKKWSQGSQSWTSPVLISDTLSANRDPNTCFHVPNNANYIPVFWNSDGGSQKRIYFVKIIIQGNSIDQNDENILPLKTRLYSNFPNPFNASTQIQYYVAKNSHIRLTVYDLLGRTISELVNEAQSPGTKSVTWNASKYASGIYFYKLEDGYISETKTMIYLR